jgi:hypothetical protein
MRKYIKNEVRQVSEERMRRDCSECIHYDTCFIQFNLHRYETFFKKDDIAKICREFDSGV